MSVSREDLHDECARLDATIDAMEIQIAALKEALKPFALEATGFERRYPFSGKHEPLTDETPLWAGGRRANLKLGDLRRARSAHEGKT